MSRTLDGTPIVLRDGMATWPSVGEDARRQVRHGLADVLTWLGEEVGPHPGEPSGFWREVPYPQRTLVIDRQAADAGGVRVASNMATGQFVVRWDHERAHR